mgnify:CR=1 FL=1
MTATCDTEKLRELFDRGLSSGLGDADAQVCIEAAINLACGGGLDDSPPCVAAADREYAIRINDARWSSPEARSEALWPLALAQIGTAGTDRGPWVRRLVEGTIRRVVPWALRRAADRVPDHADALRAAADECEREGTAQAARRARDASAAAAADAGAAAYAGEAAAAGAGEAAYAGAYAAANADAGADAGAAAYAGEAAYAAASAAASADAGADAGASADAGERDEILRLSVECALDAYAAEGRHGEADDA